MRSPKFKLLVTPHYKVIKKPKKGLRFLNNLCR